MITNKEAAEIMKIFKNVADFESKGKIREAIQEIQKAIKINPRDGNIYNRLGDLQIKLNRMAEAIDAYKKGIEAYRLDNFYRNALALCKKVLKYDPGNNDIYPIIARILVDLDEKSDALIYLFEYIERQKKNGNQREILQTADYIKTLNVRDPRVSERLNLIFREIGRHDLVEKIEQTKKTEAPVVKKTEPPAPATKEIELETITVEPAEQKKAAPKLRDQPQPMDDQKTLIREDLAMLDDSVKTIQLAVTELRKAIRIDEVVVALDKSLAVLSEQQRKAILNLQQSLNLNLDNLLKSVKEMTAGADKTAKNFEHLFSNLSSALASLSKNQAFLAQEITGKLNAVSERFATVTRDGLQEIRTLLNEYQTVSQSMCASLEKTRESSACLNVSFNDVRSLMQSTNELLLKNALTQESNHRQQRRLTLIMIIALGAIGVLTLLSLFIK